MGADYCAWILWIRKDREPDWESGRKKINELRKIKQSEWPNSYIEDFGAYDSPDEGADILLGHLEYLNDNWDGSGRECDRFDVGCYDVLSTGGMTYGDPPTETFSSISHLNSAGILDEIGFMKDANHFLLVVEDDLEPSILGPFPTEDVRDSHAKDFRKRYGDRSGIYRMDINEKGLPVVSSYSGAFFEEGDTDE